LFIKADKGFVFSMDSLVAAIAVVGAIIILSQQAYVSLEVDVQTPKITDDAIFSLEQTGYLANTLDSNNETESAVLIRQKLLESLPPGFDANVTVTTYYIDKQACASEKTFEACFPDENRFSGYAGEPAPKESFSFKKFLLRKQAPGDCNVAYMVFSEPEEKILEIITESYNEHKPEALFDANAINAVFDVNVNPDNEIVCDQNVNVTLSIRIPKDVRKAVDIMQVFDRSGSMNDSTVLRGELGKFTYNQGTYTYYQPPPTCSNYGNWIQVGSFYLSYDHSSEQIVNVYMHYTGYDGNCTYPRLRVRRPNGNWVPGSSGTSSASPIRVGISSAKKGTYTVWAWSDENIWYDINGSGPGMPTGSYGSGYLSGGTYTYSYPPIQCTSYSNWQTITTFNVDQNFAAIEPSMLFNRKNSSYTGSCSGSRFRIKRPNGTYVPDINGTTSTQITVSSPTVGIHTIEAWSDRNITSDFNVYTRKLTSAKVAAKSFTDSNLWTTSDSMGLVSYSSSATLSRTLLKLTDSNKALIKTSIDSLTASGTTATGDAIALATQELQSQRANPLSIKFQVLLSDGQSNTGMSPFTAAEQAKNAGIIIYTIGFGTDVNAYELSTIANITGGKYYYTSDANTLNEIYQLIALEVAEMANDSNVVVPIYSGTLIVNDGNGVIQDGNLVFNAGSITASTPWSTTYTLNFPCLNPNVCTASAFTFPGPGSMFIYVDSNGITRNVDFNASKTVSFKKRDLNVEFTGGTVLGKDNVVVDLLVKNTGHLDANSTDLKLYLNSLLSSPKQIIEVPPLCSTYTPGCTNNSTIFQGINLDSEGLIYGSLNDANTISECPIGNIAAINCTGGPLTQIYSIKYVIWRK
jgi:uncharacterized protein YegL